MFVPIGNATKKHSFVNKKIAIVKKNMTVVSNYNFKVCSKTSQPNKFSLSLSRLALIRTSMKSSIRFQSTEMKQLPKWSKILSFSDWVRMKKNSSKKWWTVNVRIQLAVKYVKWFTQRESLKSSQRWWNKLVSL